MKKNNLSILHKEETFHDKWAQNEDTELDFEKVVEASTSPEIRFILKEMGAIITNQSFATFCDHRINIFTIIYGRDFQNIFKSSQLKKRVVDKISSFEGCVYGSYLEIIILLKFLSAQTQRLNIFFVSKRNRGWSLNYENFISTTNSYS